MRQLSHEKLEVYQKSIEFLTTALQIIDSIPKGNGSLVDQLKRASQSIVLNIAEAAGHPTTGKAKYHFSIARGSALECGAALDVVRIIGACDPSMSSMAKELFVSIVSMPSKRCRHQDSHSFKVYGGADDHDHGKV